MMRVAQESARHVVELDVGGAECRQVGELGLVDRRDAAMADEPAGHDGRAIAQRLAAGAAEAHLGVHLREAAHRRPEMAEVDAAPVLSVSHDLESHVLLETDGVPDVPVLVGPERIRREAPLLRRLARRQQRGRPEETPDVLGAKRRRRTHW